MFKEEKVMDFIKELEHLINVCSIENESNTPDFILAQYVRHCLDAFNKACNARERWYGRGELVGKPCDPPEEVD